jgi:hypothetical protein
MAFEGLRDRWEHMAPRERTLLRLLAVTFVVCAFGFVGFMIRDGLRSIEGRNQEMRDALEAIQQHRARETDAVATPQVEIPAKAPSLATYLEEIAAEIKVTIPNYDEQPAQVRGGYRHLSMNISLANVDLYQLGQFMELVETRKPAFVITNLHVEGKSFREPDKLKKATMTVTTYEKVSGETTPKSTPSPGSPEMPAEGAEEAG